MLASVASLPDLLGRFRGPSDRRTIRGDVARQVRPRSWNGYGAMLPLETRNLARRLLVDEAAADKTSQSTESAVFRVYEKLHRSLCQLAGVAGFRSLASRALTLAKAEAPGLGAMQVNSDGFLHGTREFEPQIDKYHDEEAELILIAQLLGLLITFIGETLTLRLVQDTWPSAGLEDCRSGDRRKA